MAALTLGTLAAAAAIGAGTGSMLAMKKRAKKMMGSKPVQPPAAPALATPPMPTGMSAEDAESVAEKIRQTAGRRKEKRGRSGTLLTGPRGLTGDPQYQRRTLLGS